MANLDPWFRRPSTQAVRRVDEPRALVVLRGVFDEDVCDSAATELLAKKPWVLQGGDAGGRGGFSCSRYQLNVSKPVGGERYSHIVRKFSEVLHFTVESHTHLRSPCTPKGGSTQRWHLDNGHGRSLALIACLTDRVFEFAEVGIGI